MIKVKINPVLKPLIPDFLDNCKADIRKLESALANSDYETLKTTGHNLRGCGNGYGFFPITDLGTIIEQAAAEQDAAAIENAVNELAHYLNDVQPVFQ